MSGPETERLQILLPALASGKRGPWLFPQLSPMPAGPGSPKEPRHPPTDGPAGFVRPPATRSTPPAGVGGSVLPRPPKMTGVMLLMATRWRQHTGNARKELDTQRYWGQHGGGAPRPGRADWAAAALGDQGSGWVQGGQWALGLTQVLGVGRGQLQVQRSGGAGRARGPRVIHIPHTYIPPETPAKQTPLPRQPTAGRTSCPEQAVSLPLATDRPLFPSPSIAWCFW